MNFYQNSNNLNISIPPLENFSPESFSNLRKTFGHQILSEAVLELMHKMIAADCVWSVLLSTDELLDKEDDNYIGGNCISLLSAANEDFKKIKLSGLNLKGANFQAVDLCGSDFSSANLAKARFINVSFEKTNFSNADFSDISILEDSSVMVFFPSQELDHFLSIKNGWVYQILIKDEVEVRKLFFLGQEKWILHSIEDKGLFLLQMNSNLLRFWQFDKGQFIKEKYFNGSPIKGISCDLKDSNILLILRADNNVEFWDFNLQKFKYSLRGKRRIRTK